MTNYKIIPRRDTTANWILYNPVLLEGEMAIEIVAAGISRKIKFGDGINHWADLPYSVDFQAIQAFAETAEISAINSFAIAKTYHQVSTYYDINDIVLGALNLSKAYVLKCTTAGTTAETAPTTWGNLNDTVLDGSVVWTIIELQGANGTNGKSAYQEWLDLGNTGTEADFIASLKGLKGDTGDTGLQGTPGIDGTNGTNGTNGANATRNKLINGNFQINQRVVSGTVTLAAGTYGHDRWKAGSSGCTYTFSTVENVTTITITAGSLVQVIEGINLQSGTHILSWNGTAQGKIGAGSYGASGVTGTVTGGTNLNIEFNTGTLSLVQFEFGTIATTFEQRFITTELSLCQRYYEKSYDTNVAPGSLVTEGELSASPVVGSTYATLWSIRFIASKCHKPSVTLYNPVTGSSSFSANGRNTTDSTNISCAVENSGQGGFYAVLNNVSTTYSITVRTHYVAAAEL